MKEGVRKYTIQHEWKKFSKEIDISEINSVRERLYAKKWIGVDADGIGYGNISIRLPVEFGLFLITGTQTGHKNALSVEDYSLVKNYNFDNFYLESFGMSQPSSEALTHAVIYEVFPNVQAIIHIHSEILWNYMLKNDFLKTKEVEYGTKEMVDEVKRIYNGISVDNGSFFAMTGHTGGIISFGKGLEEALDMLKAVSGER
jgi:L-ribulose-5-phosphate 4-epimerase